MRCDYRHTQKGKSRVMKSRLIPLLWLIALSFYILAGMRDVPFHGDESTIIWMSRDGVYTFTDINRVTYHDPPLVETEQHLRFLNGTLFRYIAAFFWTVDGYHVDEINDQWVWGAGWDWNYANGHAPDDHLLNVSRLPSALMFAAGVWVIFAIGWQLDNKWVAYFASLYYALNPALLLNGRRAMFEGGLIFFSLLVVLFGVLWIKNRGSWKWAILLGVASGLAVTSKHPAVLTVASVFIACGFFALKNRRDMLQILTAGVLSLMVFYCLTPVWWGDPIQRAGQVLDARDDLLSGQVATFGGYDNFIDQSAGFLRQTFIVKPQYYEVDTWATFIDHQIQAYESTIWGGINGSVWTAGVLIMLVVLGMGVLIRRRSPQEILVLVWGGGMFISAWLLTPLEWQRYYLMTYPAVGIFAGVGVSWITHRIRLAQNKQRVG